MLRRFPVLSLALPVTLSSLLLGLTACSKPSEPAPEQKAPEAPAQAAPPSVGLPEAPAPAPGAAADVFAIPTETKSTPSGLKYALESEGSGPMPTAGQSVTVHYTGWLENGTKFDSSRDHGNPISFPLGQGQVIKGWDEGIALLKVGSKATLVIPSDLGYGANGAGGVIPPNATLIFKVELVSAQ